MTFTLELPDAVVQNLKAEAEQQHVPLQDWIVQKLQQDVGTVTSSTRSEALSDDDFEAVARRVIERDLELLQRLAK